MPRIKLSQSAEKVSLPGKKLAFRLYNKTHVPVIDLLCLAGGEIPKVGVQILCVTEPLCVVPLWVIEALFSPLSAVSYYLQVQASLRRDKTLLYETHEVSARQHRAMRVLVHALCSVSAHRSMSLLRRVVPLHTLQWGSPDDATAPPEPAHEGDAAVRPA